MFGNKFAKMLTSKAFRSTMVGGAAGLGVYAGAKLPPFALPDEYPSGALSMGVGAVMGMHEYYGGFRAMRRGLFRGFNKLNRGFNAFRGMR